MKEEYPPVIWREILDFPIGGREAKPRKTGLTMVIDKGLGLLETRELLEIAGDYIDLIKLGFGTSALYCSSLLREKIRLVRSYGVDIYPGGTFLEIAVLQGKLEAYLDACLKLGYTFIEVSDGTIEMDLDTRAKAIEMAKDRNFSVISEVGKKDPRDRVSTTQIRQTIEQDLACGVYQVIIEGRESGKGVVIYDAKGDIKHDEMEDLLGGIRDLSKLLWEAPNKNQQQELIFRFGNQVNLGNIQPADVLSLEALRLGLRGDTLRPLLKPRPARAY
jgi:phosphosulfolactate synthase